MTDDSHVFIDYGVSVQPVRKVWINTTTRKEVPHQFSFSSSRSLREGLINIKYYPEGIETEVFYEDPLKDK